MNTSFLGMEKIVSKALSAESLRLKVISDNIANSDTPNFKRSDVTFESELKRALESKKQLPFDAKLTSKKHIPFSIPKDVSSVSPKIHLDYNTEFLNNGNNVDVEQEMVSMKQVQLRYKAYTSYLNRNYRLISTLFNIR